MRLYLCEYANVHESADRFLDELRRGVRFWHGAERPAMPTINTPETELTGVGWRTGAPFPAALPVWRPGRPLPGSSAGPGQEGALGRAPGAVAEWYAVLLVAVVILGAALTGSILLGSAGAWMGSLLGLAASAVAEWKWEKWNASRRSQVHSPPEASKAP